MLVSLRDIPHCHMVLYSLQSPNFRASGINSLICSPKIVMKTLTFNQHNSKSLLHIRPQLYISVTSLPFKSDTTRLPSAPVPGLSHWPKEPYRSLPAVISQPSFDLGHCMRLSASLKWHNAAIEFLWRCGATLSRFHLGIFAFCSLTEKSKWTQSL